jgi:hypothetical protein
MVDRTEYQRNWRAANPDKVQASRDKWNAAHPTHGKDWYAANAARVRATHLKRKFGITAAQFEVILAAQNGDCLLKGYGNCHNHSKGYMAVHHTDDGVVAILCSRHNASLSYFGDTPQGLVECAALLDESLRTIRQSFSEY